MWARNALAGTVSRPHGDVATAEAVLTLGGCRIVAEQGKKPARTGEKWMTRDKKKREGMGLFRTDEPYLAKAPTYQQQHQSIIRPFRRTAVRQPEIKRQPGKGRLAGRKVDRRTGNDGKPADP